MAVAAIVLLTACTGSGAEDTRPPETTVATGSPETAATIATTTEPPTTTTTSTTSTTTTTLLPPTTIPHGAGPILKLDDGSEIDAAAKVTAQQIYDAAIIHDYVRLAEIIGENRFRWGFVGDRRPGEAWKAQFDAGKGDELARIVALLDAPAAVDDRGNTVWPYLAIKDPATWDADDEAQLARLGFNPENIIDTKAKGRYVDYRLVIDPTGRWTAFGVGY